MRYFILAAAMTFAFAPLAKAEASCQIEWKMMKRLEDDAKSIESKINNADYEEGRAGNEKCRLLRQYNYLRGRHNNAIMDWLSCSNPSSDIEIEQRRHIEDTNNIRILTDKMCFPEKGF